MGRMNDEIKLFDVVALTVDLPEYNLRPDHFMVLRYEPESDLREPVSV